MVHLRFTWLTLSKDYNDLKSVSTVRVTRRVSLKSFFLQILAETQLLQVSTLSTAVFTVFVDSAKNLPVSLFIVYLMFTKLWI